VIGSKGHAYTGNLGFTTTLTGSVGGSFARLYYSTTGSFCPPLVVLGLPIRIFPPFGVAGTTVTSATGDASLLTPLGGIPPGSTIYLQWLAVTPIPSLQVTGGLELTVSMP